MPLFTAATLTLDRDTDGSGMLRIDVPDKPVNVITAQFMTDLDAALDAVVREKLPLLTIYSGKKSGFLAGADLAGFLAVRDSAAAEELSARGQRLFDKLAALACDYRLVFDTHGTQIGLPEVELGLLPGWGGTQRLPRTIGLERALQVILGGRRLNARDAFRLGLADACAARENELRTEFDRLKGLALSQGKRRRDGLPRRTWRQWFLESNPVGRRLLFRGTERLLRRRVPDGMPAPAEALEAVRTGVKQGMAAGLEYERKAAARLAMTTASRNLIGLFFAREQSR